MITLKNNTFLASAFQRAHNSPLKIRDDGHGPLWLIGNEFGSTCVVRASSYDDALAIMVDGCQPVPQDCLHEAYGKSSSEFAAVVRAWSNDGDDIELVDGYEHQSDGHVAAVGTYVWCRHLTKSDCRDIRLVIRDHDTTPMCVTVHLAHSAYSLEIKTFSGPIKIKSLPSYRAPFEARLRKLERACGALSVTVIAAS